ncbi:MAG TPA: DUF4179 domain-containing protein, partial [Paenibacillus sp.]|nr:DUF4179 domain-containing protein [Paenibacillus sp.]
MNEPNFDAMWERIERRVSERRGEGAVAVRGRRRVRAAALIAVVAGSVLAVPAFARMPLAWDDLWQRLGVETAVKSGFGEAIDKTVTSGGVPFTLRGVVADDRQTALLFDMGVEPGDRVAAFDEASLIGEDGSETPLYAHHSVDESGKLSGKLMAYKGLGRGGERLELRLKDVVFYEPRRLEVASGAEALAEGTEIGLDAGSFSKLTIRTFERTDDLLTIRYEVEMETADDRRAGPSLELSAGGERVEALQNTVLPSEREDLLVAESTYRLTDAQAADAAWRFGYLEEVDRAEGDWRVAFESSGSMQAAVTYRKKLNVARADDYSWLDLNQLSVSPLSIRVDVEFQHTAIQGGQPDVDYRDIDLIVDGQRLEGGLSMSGTEWYLHFETPEWREDWSEVPMELVMSGAKVYRLAEPDHLLPLEPSTERRTIETELNGYPVTYTYYIEGDRLYLESDS